MKNNYEIFINEVDNHNNTNPISYRMEDVDFGEADLFARAIFLKSISEIDKIKEVAYIESRDKCKRTGDHLFEMAYRQVGDSDTDFYRHFLVILRLDKTIKINPEHMPEAKYFDLARNFSNKQRKGCIGFYSEDSAIHRCNKNGISQLKITVKEFFTRIYLKQFES